MSGSESTKQSKSSLGAVLVIVATVLVLAIVGGIMAISVIGAAISGSGDDGDGGMNIPLCTPGDGDEATSVNIPEQYREWVEAAASTSGFSANVIGSQLQHESSWNPNAKSHAGAEGLAQFMPGTWAEFGGGGDPLNPEHAIKAQGRYMKYLNDFMKDHAKDDEHLLKLALAGYNAGQGAVQRYGFDLDKMFSDPNKPGYKAETMRYVNNIVAAASGSYTSDCGHPDAVPEGSIAETSIALAWEEKVTLPRSSAYGYGESAARPEFVEASTKLNKDLHTAFFTDCGVFVATVMRTSGADKSFPLRSTGVQMNYLSNSDKYEYFRPTSEADLKAGDILITQGHIYLYTGERNASSTGRAQGASLYTRPPSGHDFYLSDTSGRTYYAARLKGE